MDLQFSLVYRRKKPHFPKKPSFRHKNFWHFYPIITTIAYFNIHHGRRRRRLQLWFSKFKLPNIFPSSTLAAERKRRRGKRNLIYRKSSQPACMHACTLDQARPDQTRPAQRSCVALSLRFVLASVIGEREREIQQVRPGRVHLSIGCNCWPGLPPVSQSASTTCLDGLAASTYRHSPARREKLDRDRLLKVFQTAVGQKKT